MQVYAQKQNRTQEKTSFKTSRLTQRAIGHQAVLELPHVNAEGREARPDAYATAPFVHDFSRIPVCSKASAKIQSKLALNTPGDKYEEEADRIAEQVVRSPEG